VGNHKRVVFTEDEALIKRGASAVEMLLCNSCKKPQCVFVGTLTVTSNVIADNTTYKKITVERWVCINCRNGQQETYAVKYPDSGVDNNLFAAYDLRMGGGYANTDVCL
jgi:hypothetical protein